MRLSASDARNGVLVAKMALVAAKSPSNPVILIFIMILLSLLSFVVSFAFCI
jgi:multisubunit Na+/H+ antiporter MnhF subunit